MMQQAVNLPRLLDSGWQEMRRVHPLEMSLTMTTKSAQMRLLRWRSWKLSRRRMTSRSNSCLVTLKYKEEIRNEASR